MSDDLIDRMSNTPGSHGDRLGEILDTNQGGERGRLRQKLAGLWGSAKTTEVKDSVERMRARNAAIRLGKNIEPRIPSRPATQQEKTPQVAVPESSVVQESLSIPEDFSDVYEELAAIADGEARANSK